MRRAAVTGLVSSCGLRQRRGGDFGHGRRHRSPLKILRSGSQGHALPNLPRPGQQFRDGAHLVPTCVADTSRPYRRTRNFDAGPLPRTIAGRPDQNRPKPDLRSPSTSYDLLTYPQAVRSFGEFGARRDGKRRFRRPAGQQPRRDTTAPQRLLRAAARAERILTTGIMADGAGFEPAIRFPVYTLSKRAP